MPRNNQNPDKQFVAFATAMETLSGCIRRDIRATNFDAWRHRGMHDKVGAQRIYAHVERRANFEIGSPGKGFLVQLEIHLSPSGRRRAAVYVRSKEFPPKATNTANLTFKFKFIRANNAYCVSFRAKGVLAQLTNPG